MRILFVFALLFSINSVFGENQIKNKSEKVGENSVKTKRGIQLHSYPVYGHGYQRYTPYAKFPTIYKSPIATYAISPGNAFVHSFNVNYPKVFLSKPVIRPAIPPPILYHPKPVLPLPSVPIYANRYPVFVHSPAIVPKPIVPISTVPQFSSFIPAIPPHIHTVSPVAVPSVLPQPTLISQDGWKPISTTVPNGQHTHIHQPAVTVLPPLNPTQLSVPSQTQPHNNYYLPPGPSFQQDIAFAQPTGNFNCCMILISVYTTVFCKILRISWNR